MNLKLHSHLIGKHLCGLDSPHQAEFYTSGRTPNEVAFLYSVFVREFGTNNFPDCSNMCHEPTSRGLPPAIGVGKGTVVLEDFEHAEAIFVMGQNPGTNAPRMMTQLFHAHKRGCPIVDGVEMLVQLAMHGFEMWTGIKPDEGVFQRAVAEALGE